MHVLMHLLARLLPPRGPGAQEAARARRDARAWFTRRAGQAARDELLPLLAAAADLDLDDEQAVARLRRRAHETTRRLAASGQLPPALTIGADDLGVVVVRTLGTAWQRVTPPPTTDQRRAPDVAPSSSSPAPGSRAATAFAGGRPGAAGAGFAGPPVERTTA